MSWKAARASALLCGLFLIVYGGTNWLTSLRAGVPTFYFNFERHIPFIPWMIVPYMSIDLFFVAAPFLCRGDRELRVFANRITAAIVIAGVCFLLFPLRFGFDRPHVEGVLGLVFNHFRSIDPPFNLFPSLHIALQIILLSVYLPRTSGVLKVALCAWFALIGFSTLLTYQHHLIDVVGGAMLGALCLHLVQHEPLRTPVVPNPRIGTAYLLGALVFTALAILSHPFWLILLWPASTFGLMASAYFGAGAGVFRKRDGQVPWLTKLLLWPVLVGQRASLAYYARQSDSWNVVTDRLWIGRKLSNREARRAIDAGVVAVLDLSGEFTEATPFLAVSYRQLSVMDLTAPTPEQLDQAVAFIREQAEQGVVYVHCKAGYSRTAAVAGAYLLWTGQVGSVDEAVAVLRAARPRIVVRTEVRRALERFTSAPVTPAASSVDAGVPSPRLPAR